VWNKEDVRRPTRDVKQRQEGGPSFHVSRFTFHEESAHVAQLVEHVLGKDEVTRSIRVVGSTQSVLDPERAR
jgi:hypothetical protein